MRLGVGAIGGFFSPSEPLGPPTGVIIKREWAPALQRGQSLSGAREHTTNRAGSEAPSGPKTPAGTIFKRGYIPALQRGRSLSGARRNTLQRSAFVSARPQEAPGIRGRPPAPKSSPARPKVGSPCRERRDFPRKRTHVVTLLIINELLVTSLFWENAPIGSWAPTSVSLTRQELPFSRAPAVKEHTVLSWDYFSHIPRHSRR